MSAELRKSIKADRVYKELQAIVAAVSKSVDADRLTDEAKQLHASRPSRKLWKVKMAPTPMYEALTKDLAARSRIVEIKMSILSESAILAQAIKSTRGHLLTAYDSDIRDVAKTQADRTRVVDKILNPAIELKSSLDSCLEIFDTYIRDLDAAGFTLTNTKDVLKLAIERRDQVV